ncbi:MAG: BACON domain-containing protein [Bacteroidales bacterium]|nr:BACON domain-containing protein [Bacteroidales bacterium]
MKKFYSIIAVLFFLLIGCEREVIPPGGDPEKDPRPATIKISTELITFSASGGTKNIEVIVSNGEWSASSDKSWCTVTKGSGIVTIKAEANSKEEPMEDAKVTITAGTTKKSIVIKQLGTKNGNTSFTLSSGTKIFTQDELQKITKGEKEGEFILPIDTKYEELPKIGEVLLINTPSPAAPEGYIGRITGVNAMPGGTFSITTERVPFEEAFSDLKIDTTGLDLADNIKEIVDEYGKPISFTKTKAYSPLATYPQAVSQQSISLRLPTVTLEIGGEHIQFSPSVDIRLGMRLQTVIYEKKLLMFNMLIDPDIKLGAEFKITVPFKGQFQKHIMTINFSPLLVGPVVITPRINFYAIVRLDGAVELVSTLSYEHSFTVGVKYETGTWTTIYRDRNEGIGKEGSPIEYGATVKIKGGAGAGVKTEVGFGIYGEVFTGDLGINTLLKGNGEVNFDLAKPSDWLNAYSQLSNTTLQSEFLIDAESKINVLGLTTSETSLPVTLSLPLDTLYLIPEMQEDVKVNINGRNVDMELVFKHKSVFTGKVIGQVSGFYSKDKLPDIEFKPEGGNYEPINNNQKIKFKSNLTNLKEGEVYEVDLFLEIAGSKIDLRRQIDLEIQDTEVTRAALAILNDLYYSAGGQSWDGCNWFEPGVDLKDFKGVSITVRPGQTPDMTVSLNSNGWIATGDMNIGDHSGGMDFDWNIQGDNRCRSIVLDDPNCSYVGAIDENTNLERVEIHSPKYDFRISSKNLNLTHIDISGSGTVSLAPIGYEGDWYKVPLKLVELNVDNCTKLKEIDLNGGNNYKKDNSNRTLNFSAHNTPKLDNLILDSLNINFRGELNNLKEITLNSCNISGLNEISSNRLTKVIFNFYGGGSMDKLTIKNSPNLEHIYTNFRHMTQSEDIVFNGLEVTNCEKLLELVVNNLDLNIKPLNSLLGTLSVTNCKNLVRLDAENLKLRELALSDLPSLVYIYVRSNLMTGLILPVFDEVRDRRYDSVVKYDVRYEYYDVGWEIQYVDNGVGYWYSGEPDRGYHIR